MIRRALLAVAILPLWLVSAQAKDLGSFGRTYPVAEKDALTEIEDRAGKVDWSNLLYKKKVENYQGPPDSGSLPRAQHERVPQVDMTYTT